MLNTLDTSEINGGRILITDLRQFLQASEGTPDHEGQESHMVRGTLLCFCQQGTASIRINYTTYNLEPGSVLAILPTHIIQLIQTSQDCGTIEALIYSDDYWTAIAQSIDYQLIRTVERNPLVHLSEVQLDEIATLIAIIRRHEAPAYIQQHDATIDRYAVRGTAYAALMLLVAGQDRVATEAPHPAGRKEELTHDFFDLLAQYFETERRVSFYASKLCVTPKYLSTVVKEVTHSSIMEWINNVTILIIKRRLLTGAESIQQLSEELNFQTPSTLVRYFRHQTGTTPSRFRSEHSAQN